MPANRNCTRRRIRGCLRGRIHRARHEQVADEADGVEDAVDPSAEVVGSLLANRDEVLGIRHEPTVHAERPADVMHDEASGGQFLGAGQFLPALSRLNLIENIEGFARRVH